MAQVSRVIALGASNLTRGLPTVVSSARTTWGRDVELLGALGHGRSYGIPSRFAARTLPGILHSGLWRTLDSLSPATSRGLVTDVGNDVIYEVRAPLILEWVGDAIDRLQAYTSDIVLTDLPVDALRKLKMPAFIAVRTLLAPKCRLTLSQAVETAERVNYGLAQMAERRRLRFVHMRPEWYGVDPIHIRPSLWHPAWQHILGDDVVAARRASWREAMGLYCMLPERQTLFGLEQARVQSGRRLRRGGKIWLF